MIAKVEATGADGLIFHKVPAVGWQIAGDGQGVIQIGGRDTVAQVEISLVPGGPVETGGGLEHCAVYLRGMGGDGASGSGRVGLRGDGTHDLMRAGNPGTRSQDLDQWHEAVFDVLSGAKHAVFFFHLNRR